MKIRVLILLSLTCVINASFAHDDMVYRTASSWSFDAGNQSAVSSTCLSPFLGGAVVADYNGDGIPDLCEIDTSSEEMRWIWKLGDGQGGWSEITPITFGESATDQCTVGDFNGDGQADLGIGNLYAVAGKETAEEARIGIELGQGDAGDGRRQGEGHSMTPFRRRLPVNS